MKKFLVILIFTTFLTGCSLFKNNKTGCPTNGKNVGAERVLSGDKNAIRAAGKAKKFKS